MKKYHSFSILFAILIAFPAAFANGQSASPQKSRVALFGFINLTGDGSFDVPAETAGNALYISLRTLGLYEVSMPESIPRNLGEEGLASWCTKNGIDTVLYGTVSASGDSQEYGLSAFDNAKKAFTIRKTAKGSSVLDVFGISDRLITSMLDSITGHHVSFGIVEFKNIGVPGTYSASIDDLDLGKNPGTIDHVTSGTHRMTVTQGTGVARTVVTSVSVTVAEGKKETVSFELKDMKSSESKETAEVVTIPADQHGVKKDYTEFVQHLSSLTGKYTQTSGKNSGFVHMLSPFSIGKYEVTYVLWFTVYQWATSADRGPAGYTFVTSEKNTFTSDPSQDSEVKTANQPMVGVSWRDCIIWCNARSEMEGLEPVYYADSKFKEPLRSSQDQDAKDTTRKGSVDNPYVKTGSKGYRLPTSGEWQYAASCGGLYPYNHASGADVPINENSWLTPLSSENFDNDGDGTVASTEEVAWFSVNSNFVTHTVGTRAPNRWALYDMSGNVGEWTFDWEGSLPQSRQTDYSGPKSGTNRIIRGGNAFNGWLDLRISSFRQSPPYFENQFTGFRVVRSE